jgi:hypothetical protein
MSPSQKIAVIATLCLIIVTLGAAIYFEWRERK